MQVHLPPQTTIDPALARKPESAAGKLNAAAKDDQELHDAFQSFVGETLFGQMHKSMRKTVGKPAYLHGGRGEEVFQEQLDQVLAEKMSRSCSDRLAGPMYDLFSMNRR